MKSMVSLPLVAKAGGGAVAASGVITGGVLLHKHFEFPKGLDKELINEEEATLVFSNDSRGNDFLIDDSKQNEATIKVKATSTKSDSKFSSYNSEKWACVIKGIATETGSTTPNLSQESSFNKSEQKSKLESKLATHKKGFVKSCAKSRSITFDETDNWIAEIVVNLKPTVSDNNKYEFSNEDIDSIFEGTWINSEVS